MRSKFKKLYCTLKQKFPEFNWFILKAYSKEFGEYYQIWAEKAGYIYYAECYFKEDGYPSVTKMVREAEYQLEPYLIEGRECEAQGFEIYLLNKRKSKILE